MPFTVRDFPSLIRALERAPEWKAELRRLLLTEEVLGLPELMRQLAARVEELAAAQARTAARVEELAAAQARTEARVEELAAAQARTEERVGRLEEAVERLAAAQARTEERVEELAAAQREMARQVGALAETVGFTLEDLAREVTPPYLEKHGGIRVASLERRFFLVGAEELEVDLYGEGTRDGERVVVVGEVKSRIHGRDVEALVRRIGDLAGQLPGVPLPLLFGFVVHPSAREAAARVGAVVITSSGRP
jgi:predicted nuclease with TOPRIM domain